MKSNDKALLEFLERQTREYGGHIEVDAGLWAMFVVAQSDTEANALASSLLEGAGFDYNVGESEDDKWMLYYVGSAQRQQAISWLQDLIHGLTGQLRQPSLVHLSLIEELTSSEMPHRIAQRLVELHTSEEISAGSIRDGATVRALLDRLHSRDPLIYSALQSLMANHLIDIRVLKAKLIDEDIELINEMMKGGVSQNPFYQSRQAAAAGIRNLLIQYHLINPLDQQRSTAAINPYAGIMDINFDGEEIAAHIDNTVINVPRTNFIEAIHSIRRNLSRGEKFESFNTQVPWMSDSIAYSFRFIKECLDSHRELSTLDGLYMLERAVEP